jgi:hypothetical protein
VLAELADWSQRIGSLHGEIRDELVEEQPDLSEFEWPDPSEPDEDPDPLFDARRGYLEQVDRFKRHQGKRTKKRPGRWEKVNGGGAEP